MVVAAVTSLAAVAALAVRLLSRMLLAQSLRRGVAGRQQTVLMQTAPGLVMPEV
jgi:hypothetical protein